MKKKILNKSNLLGECSVKRVWLVLFVAATFVAVAKAQEKVDPEDWIRGLERTYSNIDCYTAIFHKQERVNGKLLEEETISIKFKKPFKVYMRWIKDPYKGRETLYIDSWNKNQMKVRESGMAGVITVNLDPKGSLAMKRNRHPITESGLGHVVKLIGENLRKGIRTGNLKFQQHGEETMYGRKTHRVEIIFPQDKAKGYYCYRVNINLDVEQKVPIKIQIYDWDDILIETYGYEGLNLNPGLTDVDFDTENPEYKLK